MKKRLPFHQREKVGNYVASRKNQHIRDFFDDPKFGQGKKNLDTSQEHAPGSINKNNVKDGFDR